ncbi:MAG: DUF922 domain-containing protein, partial [Steroidobacteraceae bacterium]
MGGTKSDLLGTQPGNSSFRFDDDEGVLGDGETRGPIGIDEPVPLDVARIIAKVTNDWTPPNPTKTPEIIVRGATLAAVGKELMQLGEWGKAGGSLAADSIEVGTTTDLTINLHGNLLYLLPEWSRYANASAAAKVEWDKMFKALTAHEDRHLAIAIEEGNALAKELVGKDIAVIARRVTAANLRMKQRQDKLDHATQNGSKEGVLYGDVTLDIS